MEEEQINSVPFRPDPQSLLSSHKREIAAQLEQELLQAFTQSVFEFGLRVLVFEVEELEDERVADLGIRLLRSSLMAWTAFALPLLSYATVAIWRSNCRTDHPLRSASCS